MTDKTNLLNILNKMKTVEWAAVLINNVEGFLIKKLDTFVFKHPVYFVFDSEGELTKVIGGCHEVEIK